MLDILNAVRALNVPRERCGSVYPTGCGLLLIDDVLPEGTVGQNQVSFSAKDICHHVANHL